MITGIHLFIPILLNVDVAQEIERQNTFWRKKGKEIEDEFKKLYKPQPAPKLKKKGKKTKQMSHERNEELSSYAAALTKELLIKVSLQNHLFISFVFLFLCSLCLPFHLIMRIKSRMHKMAHSVTITVIIMVKANNSKEYLDR